MSYKKLLSLLAASSLALVACGDDTATEEPATEETTEDAGVEEEATEEEAADDTADGEEDTFDRAANRDDADATVPVGLEVQGQWSTDGYVVVSEGDEAVVNLTAFPEDGVEEYYIYVTDEDGTILEKAESEMELAYTVSGVDAEQTLYAGTSEEDLGDVDDTVNPEEDFVRHEKVIVQPGEATTEEAE